MFGYSQAHFSRWHIRIISWKACKLWYALVIPKLGCFLGAGLPIRFIAWVPAGMHLQRLSKCRIRKQFCKSSFVFGFLLVFVLNRYCYRRTRDLIAESLRKGLKNMSSSSCSADLCQSPCCLPQSTCFSSNLLWQGWCIPLTMYAGTAFPYVLWLHSHIFILKSGHYCFSLSQCIVHSSS